MTPPTPAAEACDANVEDTLSCATGLLGRFTWTLRDLADLAGWRTTPGGEGRAR